MIGGQTSQQPNNIKTKVKVTLALRHTNLESVLHGHHSCGDLSSLIGTMRMKNSSIHSIHPPLVRDEYTHPKVLDSSWSPILAHKVVIRDC